MKFKLHLKMLINLTSETIRVIKTIFKLIITITMNRLPLEKEKMYF